MTGIADALGSERVLDIRMHPGSSRAVARAIGGDFNLIPEDSDTNKVLFAFVAYNAGPGRIHSLREEARKKGFNPNVWIDNVELVAAARIGTETVTYVANIYKYYIAYKLVAQREKDGIGPSKK